MRVSFFLLPFFLYAGVFLQQAGIFFFCILIPFLASGGLPSSSAKEFRRLSFCLFIVWLVFPANNLFQFYLDSQPFLFSKEIFRSHLPTTVLLSSIGLFCGSYFPCRKETSSQVVVKSFLNGLFYATLIYFSYCFLQFITGFSYNQPGLQLSDAQKMTNGFFRIGGFYGHPLSLAAVCVFLFLFIGHLALQASKFSEMKQFRNKLFVVSACHFVLCFMSGSRAAGVLAFLGLLFLIQRTKKMSTLMWCLCFAFGLGSLYVSGILSRLLEMTAEHRTVYRFVFWKAHLQMIMDAPILGHGSFQMKEFVRDLYYHTSFIRKYNAHNLYLQTLSEVGIFGFMVIVVCSFVGFKSLRRVFQNTHFANSLFQSSFLAVGATLLFSLFQNVFFDAQFVAVFLGIFWFSVWVASLEKLSAR